MEHATFLREAKRPVVMDVVTPKERTTTPLPKLNPERDRLEFAESLRLIGLGMVIGGWLVFALMGVWVR